MSVRLPESWFSNSFNVLLIGAGGNGSEMFDNLQKIDGGLKAFGHNGINVIVIDDDEVAEHNIVRQRFWPHEVGINKAVALVNRANMALGLDWTALPYRFTERDSRVLVWADLIITAVDNLAARQAVFKVAPKAASGNHIWLDMGVERNKGQVIVGHLLNGNSLTSQFPNVVAHYPDLLTEKDKPETASCSALDSIQKQDLFINQTVAQLAAELLWQALRTGEWRWNGGYVDLKQAGQTSFIPFLCDA